MPPYRLAAVVLLSLVILTPRPGRADDELSQFVQRTKLAAQKLATDVNVAVAQSKVLERSDPDQAKALLERMVGQVRDSRDLADAERARLNQQLQVRLRQVAETARARRVTEEQQAAQRPAGAEKLDRPQGGGTGPSAIAGGFIDQGKGQLDAARNLRAERANGFTGAMRGVETSAVPITGDVTFAKNWKELSEIRKKTVGPQLSAKEVALLKALNSTISVDFKDMPLKDVLNYLMDRTGLPIIVDQASLREAMVDYEEDKVTLKINKIAVRTLLRKILADQRLGYILKEGTVQVLTDQKARETMVVRTYPINDLVAPAPYLQMFGPFVSQAQMLGNAQQIILMIQNSIDPPMWNVNGGPASVTFSPQAQALVVRASAEMHYSLAGQLFR